MSVREKRFVGKTRAWQLKCSQCPAQSKVIGGVGHRSLPPNIIVKKLTQTGWCVGDNPKRDLCPECLRKPIKSRLATASKAISDAKAPMVAVNGEHRVHLTEIKTAIVGLDADRSRELIELLKQNIPVKPARKPRPKAEPPLRMEQADYESWLTEEEQRESKP